MLDYSNLVYVNAIIDKGLYELLQDEGNRQVLIKSLTDSLDK